MFSFFGKLFAKSAINSNSLLKLITEKTQNILSSTPYQGIPEDIKKKTSEDIIQLVLEIESSQNKILRLRNFLVTNLTGLAKTYVLLVTEQSDNLNLLNKEGISGELNSKIIKICRESKDYSLEVSVIQDEEINEYIYTKFLMHNLFCQILNIVRISLGDYDKNNPSNDWYKPFHHAMAVFAEDNFRKDIGLPSLFKGLGSLTYSMMIQEVLSDSVNPYLSWKEKYDEQIKRENLNIPEF